VCRDVRDRRVPMGRRAAVDVPDTDPQFHGVLVGGSPKVQERQLQSLPVFGFLQISHTLRGSSNRGSAASPHWSQTGSGTSRSTGRSFTELILTLAVAAVAADPC